MEGVGHGCLRIPFAGVWREEIFWDIAASTPLGNVSLWCFSSGNLRENFFEHLMVRGVRCRVKPGRYFPRHPTVRRAIGDNALGGLLSYHGGSSFLSVSAQPELRALDLLGPLSTEVSEDHHQGILFGVVLCMARIHFLAASLKLHGLNE